MDLQNVNGTIAEIKVKDTSKEPLSLNDIFTKQKSLPFATESKGPFTSNTHLNVNTNNPNRNPFQTQSKIAMPPPKSVQAPFTSTLTSIKNPPNLQNKYNLLLSKGKRRNFNEYQQENNNLMNGNGNQPRNIFATTKKVNPKNPQMNMTEAGHRKFKKN
ncbi:MAG: hypothetical protein MJ252_28465 [archaeon]|nr:hypothetical protein [archaeon]